MIGLVLDDEVNGKLLPCLEFLENLTHKLQTFRIFAAYSILFLY